MRRIFGLCDNIAAVFRKTGDMRDMHALVQHLGRKSRGEAGRPPR
jgi:hypothetical protein